MALVYQKSDHEFNFCVKIEILCAVERRHAIYMIPLSLAYKIFPSTVEPRKHLVIYTFTENDVAEESYESTTYRIPFSPETFWTNFRFGSTQSGTYTIELFLITTQGDSITLTKQTTQNEWHSTEWPLPSFPYDTYSGLYLRVIYPKEENTVPVSMSILGFARLFPISNRYLLYSHEHTARFLFLYEQAKSTYHSLSHLQNEQGTPLRPISHYH
jgi:hypothetical protein